MAHNFDHCAQLGNRFLSQLAQELGYPEEKDKASRILQAVLHALRNQLTPEESVHVLAQLPLPLKAIFVVNWKLHQRKRKIRHVEDFFSDVLGEDGKTAFADFPEGSISWMVAKTLHLLGTYISPGEAEDIVAVLPKALKPFIRRNLGAPEMMS